MADVISLMGPTASGKTKLAVEIAHKINGEIISVDSALVYRGMDIGTAKPDADEMEGIPHHLIDIHDPAENYSAADFWHDAVRTVKEIKDRGHFPILTGGTMLYFHGLTEGLSQLPETSPEVRRQVTDLIKDKGLPYVRELVHKYDPDTWGRLSFNDSQRLGRALEIWIMTGRSMTDVIKENKPIPAPFVMKEFALMPEADRRDLRVVIRNRFMKMLDQGFEKEVRNLMMRDDLNADLASMRAVGYRQMWSYLAGTCSYEEMIEAAVTATCRLAKRQMTWIRGWKSKLILLKPEDYKNADIVISTLK